MKTPERSPQLGVISLAALTLLIFSFSVTVADSSSSSEVWRSTFGGSEDDFGQSVQGVSDGGYLVAGSTLSFGAGGSEVYLVKVDQQGSEVWSSAYGGSEDEHGWAVQETGEGGYIVVGDTNSSGSGGIDVYLVKVDSRGGEEWSRALGGSGDDVGQSVQVTGDRGFIVAGFTYSFGSGGTDVYLVKTDSQGQMEWSRALGGSEDDYGWAVQETDDGGYIVAGSTLSFGAGGSDVYLMKVDSQGMEEWSRAFGGSKDEFGYSVQETGDGGYIVTGYTYSFGAGGGDVYLVKVDSQGREEWNSTSGNTDVEFGVSVRETGDGGYIVTGLTYSFLDETYDVYLLKTDSQGEEEWISILGGPGDDWGQSVQVTGDGGYIVGGSTRSFGSGLWDVYLLKTDSEGRDEEIYSASILKVEGPYEVFTGDSFTVKVTVAYEFTVPTEMSPGIYDEETQKFIAEEFETLEGKGTETYTFELTAPNKETTWSLTAGVWYPVGGELLHDEVDWAKSFEVHVTKLGGIPGFPYLSIIVGLVITMCLLERFRP